MLKEANSFRENKKNWIYVILAVLILAQSAYIVYCFAAKKKDFHSDEIWSYGPANSYETPFFYTDNEWKNMHTNEWLPGRLMDEYLSVEEGERFAYAHVYKNTSKDLHQPLYFFLLHTVCSFFPGQFSWWYGFILNMAFFVTAQIFLFLLVRKITNNEFFALMICFTYGFSQAAVNTYVYIRMYSMITCLGLISAYLHAVLYKEPDKMKKVLPLIWLVTVAGGMTHSFFLAFAGILSACFCFYYLFKRDVKCLLVYAPVLLSAAAAVLVLYPSTVGHAQTYGERNNLLNGYGGLWFEYGFLISFMCDEMFGIKTLTLVSYWDIYFVEILLVILIIACPACFLCRKEEWFRRGMKKMLNTIRNLPCRIIKQCNGIAIILAVVSYGVILVTARVAHVFFMGKIATRYVFMIEPYIFIVLFMLIGYFLNLIGKFIMKKLHFRKETMMKHATAVLLAVMACLIPVNTYYNSSKGYYFDYGNDIDFYLTEMPRNANYIFALKNNWLLDCLCGSMRGIENFFATEYTDLFSVSDELIQLQSKDEVYLIFDIPSVNDLLDSTEEVITLDEEYFELMKNASDIENKTVKNFLNKYEEYFHNMEEICNEFTYMGISEVFGRRVFVFRIRS